MSTEERFDRIEHITAALAEERKKDRDEYKALWRETQRQIDDLVRASAGVQRDLASLTQQVDRLALETRMRFIETAQRTDALVSAIGELATHITTRDELRLIIREELQRARQAGPQQ